MPTTQDFRDYRTDLCEIWCANHDDRLLEVALANAFADSSPGESAHRQLANKFAEHFIKAIDTANESANKKGNDTEAKKIKPSHKFGCLEAFHLAIDKVIFDLSSPLKTTKSEKDIDFKNTLKSVCALKVIIVLSDKFDAKESSTLIPDDLDENFFDEIYDLIDYNCASAPRPRYAPRWATWLIGGPGGISL